MGGTRKGALRVQKEMDIWELAGGLEAEDERERDAVMA